MQLRITRTRKIRGIRNRVKAPKTGKKHVSHPIFTEDHDLIRSQLRRFVDEQVRPHGPKWEEAGFVPR